MIERREILLSKILQDVPVTFQRFLVLVLVVLAMIFEGYDIMIMPYVLPQLEHEWHLTPVELGSLASYGSIGLLLGAIILAPAADRIGRRPIIILGFFWFSVFTGFTILSESYASFAIFRILAGIGIGGVMPVAVSIAAEYAPPHRRGLWVSCIYAGYIVGWVLAAAVAIFLIPLYGWKGMFAVGLIPIVYGFVLIRWLPESMQILAKKRKFVEIRQCLNRLGYAQFMDQQYIFKLDQVEEKNSLGKLSLLFGKGMGVTTVLLWFATFFTLLFMFGYATWLPALMVKSGHGLVKSYSFSLVVNMAQVVGNLAMGAMMDKFGPKRITIIFYSLLIISVLLYGMGTSNAYVYLFSMLVGFFTAVQAGINNIMAHVYPMNVRASGIGWNAGVGRLGSILGPIIVGWLAGFHLSLEGFMVSFAFMTLLAMLAVLFSPVRYSREENHITNESVHSLD